MFYLFMWNGSEYELLCSTDDARYVRLKLRAAELQGQDVCYLAW